MNKKGMSQIVTTVIIIVLILVAIGIVWTVVSNLISDSSDDIELDQFTTRLDIQSAYTSGSDVVVKVKRLAGEGDLTKVKFVITNGTDSESFEQVADLSELQEKTYSFTPTMPLAGIETVSVTPIYNTGSGSDTIGTITSSIDLGGEGTSPGGGGEGECGDNIINGDDVCDGTDLGVETCITQGYESGTLSCLVDCTAYDTSACTGGDCTGSETQLCPLQEGVCVGSEQTCVGDAWPGCTAVYEAIPTYEATEASCDDGLDNDCDGFIDHDPEETDCEYTWAGTVGTPWPTETKILFDIVETTTEFITPTYLYTTMYMGFSGTSIETRCLQIHDYVTPSETSLFDKAIVRLDDAPDGNLPINISSGDTFTIYETSQCGA